MSEEKIKKYRIIRYENNRTTSILDKIVAEKEISIYINDKFYTKILITPDEINELIYGILFIEGYPEDYNKNNFSYREEKNNIFITIDYEQKNFVRKIQNKIKPNNLSKVTKLEYSDVINLVKCFQKLPNMYSLTGGTHSAALSANNEILLWSEDISRRNAIDKVIGKAIIRKIRLDDKALVLSCRITSDIVMKAFKSGIPILISISAPTDKAIDNAKNNGITLYGFVRGNRFNIYNENTI